MPRKQDEPAKLVTFGEGGNTVEYTRNHHSSWYRVPENFFGEGAYDPADFEGVPYVDKRPAIATDEGFKFVFTGPMCNVDLAPGEVDRFDMSNAMGSVVGPALMLDEGNAYGSILGIALAQNLDGSEYGSLDSVDTATYLALWRKLGAEIGEIRGGKFIPAS